MSTFKAFLRQLNLASGAIIIVAINSKSKSHSKQYMGQNIT